jgi:hypothetical protein
LEPLIELPRFQCELCNGSEELEMNKDRIAGGVKKVIGTVKEAIQECVSLSSPPFPCGNNLGS